MALPRVLKNFNLFANGNSLMGVAEEVALPKLSRKMEDYQGAGMPAPVEIDLGNEKLEMEFTANGFLYEAVKQYGAVKVDANLWRFAGAYQREDTGAVDAIEVVARGRFKEIDFGTSKIGDKNKSVFKAALSYYKLTVNNEVLIEIDAINCIFSVNGVDLMADQRKAIGLA